MTTNIKKGLHFHQGSTLCMKDWLTDWHGCDVSSRRSYSRVIIQLEVYPTEISPEKMTFCGCFSLPLISTAIFNNPLISAAVFNNAKISLDGHFTNNIHFPLDSPHWTFPLNVGYLEILFLLMIYHWDGITSFVGSFSLVKYIQRYPSAKKQSISPFDVTLEGEI